jgi:hypothetical protein
MLEMFPIERLDAITTALSFSSLAALIKARIMIRVTAKTLLES